MDKYREKFMNYILSHGLGVTVLVIVAIMLFYDRQALWTKVENIEQRQDEMTKTTIKENTEALNRVSLTLENFNNQK